MTVMVSMLRRHGATMVQRHGRLVAADFGSATSEAAICRSRVGLAERSDRATLELRGPQAEVDLALREVGRLGDRAWVVRSSARRALIRCEGDDEDAAVSLLHRAEDVTVVDRSPDYAALELIGPRAAEVLAAALLDEDEDDVTLVHQGEGVVELLVPRGQGPAMWNRLLEAGEPYGIACVGFDALEHLAVSDHATIRRRPPTPAP